MRLPAIVALLVAIVLGLMGSVYVVREDQTGLVLNLGRVARADIPPGLHFKWPLVETARVFDRRFQVLETQPERYLTSERKDVSIDFFAVGHISDVRAFYRATGGDEKLVNDRLAPIITDVYERMRAQRQQVASQLRAEGAEQARTITAQADRDKAVLVAEAERDAQRMRGEGDAEAARIYAAAANKDPAFFAFQRSLDAYRASFADGNSVIVLDKDDPFLQYLKSDR